mmetsp:Transcript_82829/g.208618  ORF Transcript_82829/g.208618 Transcript_82829/m.208618 type:complete len:210 (-) Transcript_82829:431-1060(-)
MAPQRSGSMRRPTRPLPAAAVAASLVPAAATARRGARTPAWGRAETARLLLLWLEQMAQSHGSTLSRSRGAREMMWSCMLWRCKGGPPCSWRQLSPPGPWSTRPTSPVATGVSWRCPVGLRTWAKACECPWKVRMPMRRLRCRRGWISCNSVVGTSPSARWCLAVPSCRSQEARGATRCLSGPRLRFGQPRLLGIRCLQGRRRGRTSLC